MGLDAEGVKVGAGNAGETGRANPPDGNPGGRPGGKFGFEIWGGSATGIGAAMGALSGEVLGTGTVGGVNWDGSGA